MRAGRATDAARVLLIVVAAAALVACGGPPPAPPPSGGCTASYDGGDGLSPSYRPNAPVRTVVGHGHVLTGVVRSGRDCTPIAGARVELWPEIAGKGHPDAQRATVLAATDGSYRFESDPPEHIHMRVSAPGFRPVATNRYHPEGHPTGRFDILLTPAAG
jgi:hypothetical protein